MVAEGVGRSNEPSFAVAKASVETAAADERFVTWRGDQVEVDSGMRTVSKGLKCWTLQMSVARGRALEKANALGNQAF